jgi:hypothetical protein
MRALPQQQQLVLCAATKLLGQTDASEVPDPALANGGGPSTPTSTSKVRANLIRCRCCFVDSDGGMTGYWDVDA